MEFQLESDSYTKITRNEVTYSSRGNPTYHIELFHEKLKESIYVKATDPVTLKNRLNNVCKKWSLKWLIADKERDMNSKNNILLSERNSYKDKIINLLDNWVDFDLNDLLRDDPYTEEVPIMSKVKKYRENRSKPYYFENDYNWFMRTFKKKYILENEKKRKEDFDYRLNLFNKKENIIKNEIEEYNLKNKQVFDEKMDSYNKRKAVFDHKKEDDNNEILEIIEKQKQGNQEALQRYFDLLFKEDTQSIDIEYEIDSKTLIIDFQFLDIDDIKKVKEYKLNRKKVELIETYLSEKELFKIYDTYIFNSIFYILAKAFYNDKNDLFGGINLNGWVENIDKKTGKDQTVCILSFFSKKNDFNELNLKEIDPKTSFNSFKGICNPLIASITPIRPILEINREDKRFTSSYDVVEGLNEYTNLAAMHWEDFEHLVRELFQKEFSENGGEVKITQASRDGGVDAIAFDPDPIKGGKIIIQAKRYTNTVGVSAVRDLYGTVMNEGANKGILVTTSNYGPDSIEFAKDKPLTLLTGNNLLYLLEKHGYRAKIDIKEAKEILSLEN